MSADLDTLVSRARSHTLGDIPRRSARRQPDKIAIVDGDVVLTFAEFEHLVDRAAAALCDNGFQPGDRVALLAHNCWQYAVVGVRDGAGRSGSGTDQLHAHRRGDRLHSRSQQSWWPAGRGRSDAGGRARDASRRDGHDDGSVGTARAHRARRLGRLRPVVDHHYRGTAPRHRGRPAAAADVHQRHRIAPQGGDAQQPQLDVAVRQHASWPARCRATTSRSTRCRCITARSWTTSWPPMYTSARRASCCRGRIPSWCFARSSNTASRTTSPRRRCGSACCAAPSSTTSTCPACARGTTAHRRCPPRSSPRSATAFPSCGCGTSTARPSWRLWPRRWGPTSRTRTPVLPDAR